MESITRNGVLPTNQTHETEYEGDTKVTYDDVTLGDYDSADDGNGNAFDLMTISGYNRLKAVHLEVQGAAYDAQYDYENNAIRVYQLSDGSEVAQGTTLDIDIRVEVRGNG